MSIISRLAVVLGLDTAEFNAGLGKAEQGINKFSAMSGLMKTGVIALGGALVATAKNALDFADEMTDLAKANEMSVASVLELTQALTTSGGKVENAGKLIASFTNKVDEAAQGSQKTRDKFKELGVSLSDLGKLSQEDLLRKTLDGLSKIEDPIRRNALAFDLLGKAAKGVDFKTLADDMKAVKGEFDKSEESFRKIEKFSDNIAAAWFRAKVNIADAIVGIAEVADREMEKVFFKQKKYANQTQAILSGDLFYNSSDDGKFKPITDTKVYKPDFTATNVPNANRPMLASDEATKLADKIKNQTEALKQNVLQLQLQTSELTKAKSMAEQIKLQFEQGGRYQDIKNQKDKEALITAAEAYDLAKHNAFVQDYINKNQKEFNARKLQELEMAQQLAATENIRMQQHQDQQRFRQEDLEAAIKRQELEKAMAGQADIVVDRALKLYDLQQKINQEKRQNGLLSETEIEQWRTLEQRLIKAQEANKRAQNTFQAGWDRAWNNFMTTAQDSANMGSQAFGSMVSGMERALDRFVQTGKLSFKELIGSMIQDLIKLQLRAQVSGFFSMIGDALGSAFSSGGVSATAGAYGIDQNPYLNWSGPRAAAGGYIDGMTLVGEAGPELFIPKTSGNIVPNNQLSSIMGGGEKIVYNAPVVQNMSAIDTQSALQFLSKYKDGVWAANQSANRSMPMQRA